MIDRPVEARKARPAAARRKAQAGPEAQTPPMQPVAGDVAEAIFRTFCWLARQPGGGLTVRQVAAVLELSRMGEVDFGDTATRLGVSRPTLSRIVERLVESGLVRRREKPEDRRRLLVSVTPHGVELAENILEMARGREGAMPGLPLGGETGAALEADEAAIETRPLLLSGTLSFVDPLRSPATGQRRSRRR